MKEYEFQNSTRNNATRSPIWEISDTRTPKYINNDDPKVTHYTPLKYEKTKPLRDIPSFTNFVSNFARVHGYNYQSALKDKDIKDLYRQSLSGDLNTTVKQSLQKRKKIDKSIDSNVGKVDYVDNRLSEDVYKETDLQELSRDQKLYNISRGLYLDLKRSFLLELRTFGSDYQYFLDSNHTEPTFLPISDNYVKTILDSVIKTRNKNIFSISPFMELSILSSSFQKYSSVLQSQGRSIFEYPLSTFSIDTISRMGLQSTNMDINNIKSSDTFFLNISSLNFGGKVSKIVMNKLNTQYDMFITTSLRWNTISDFYNSPLGRKVVLDIVNLQDTDPVYLEIIKSLTNSNASSNIIQETNNAYLSNLNTIMQGLSGDTRNLISTLQTNQGDTNDLLKQLISKNSEVVKRDDSIVPISEAIQIKENLMKEVDSFYYTAQKIKVSELEQGDIIINSATNTSGKFYEVEKYEGDEFILDVFNKDESILSLENIKSDKIVTLIIIPETRDEIYDENNKLKNNIKMKKLSILEKNLRKETFEVLKQSNLQLINGLSINEISFLTPKKKKPGDQPEEEEPEGPDDQGESSTGQGVLGGSLSDDLSLFKQKFNPSFKYIGKSGIENIYKLSF